MHTADHAARRPGTRLIFLGLLVCISLSCKINSNPGGKVEQVKPAEPAAPVDPGKVVGIGFTNADCQTAGITFSEISTSYLVDDVNNGPYLMCNASSQGAHGSIQAYISITALQPGKLDGSYQNQKAAIKGYVDQSTAWNADPDVPAEVKDVISILYDDNDGYVFMITSEANVQKCYQGRGYGTLILFDKYLANMQYVACELADTAAYTAMMNNLQTTAIMAALRVENEIAKGK